MRFTNPPLEFAGLDDEALILAILPGVHSKITEQFALIRNGGLPFYHRRGVDPHMIGLVHRAENVLNRLRNQGRVECHEKLTATGRCCRREWKRTEI